MQNDSKFIQKYPNSTIDSDKVAVTTAVVFLWIVAGLAIAAGLFLALVQPSEVAVLGWITAATGFVYAGCALFIQIRHSTGATILAGVLVALNLLGAFMSVNLIAIGINAVFLVVIFRAHKALGSIKMRVALSDQESPLTAYYHALVPLVVDVMKADGKIDSAEIAEFNNMCDKMHISDFERKLLMDKAMQSNEPISVLVQRFIQAAEALGVEDPAGHLIEALLVMAGADRQLHPAEKQVIRKAAVVARYDETALEHRFKQAEMQFQNMTRQQALELLGLPEGAGRDQIEASYQRLRKAAEPEDYLHVGQAVAQKVMERRDALDRARSLLLAPQA